MHGESESPGGLNLRAVGAGMVWGLGLLVVAMFLQAVVSAMSPMSEATLGMLGLVYKGLGALIGGYVAARRAAASGWMHGAIAGVSLALSLAAVMGLSEVALPTLADFLKAVGVGTLLGALGGVAGVNAGKQ